MTQPDKRTPRERRFDLFLELGRVRDDADVIPRLSRVLARFLPERRGLAPAGSSADGRRDRATTGTPAPGLRDQAPPSPAGIG